ncbi:MAG: AMP-binding protein, partial [Planctomycetaceae bacterium]|nr:AMP-binding protein [Planctomycetaceae bacterium]
MATQDFIQPAKSTVRSFDESESAPRRLHHYFERQCDIDPEFCALVCDGVELSYRELDSRANQVAHYLVERGVGAGSRIGLLVDRSVHAYLALIGALKSGACYVPIDPTAPPDRISYIAQDADFDILLTTSKFNKIDVQCPVLAIDSAAHLIESMSTSRLRDSEDDGLCYIIYTSGTTGNPKGVMITHSSICNLLEVSRLIYGVSAGDRVLQGMSFSFDFSVEEVWHTLAAGGTMIAGPTDHRKMGGPLAEFLEEHDVNVFCCVPTLLATVPRAVSSVHTVIVG